MSADRSADGGWHVRVVGDQDGASYDQGGRAAAFEARGAVDGEAKGLGNGNRIARPRKP